MVDWQTLAEAEPELAGIGAAAFDKTGLTLIGTIRRDGSPRISPVEHLFFEGELLLGMMHRSTKALDLLRDPRCTIHATVCNKDGHSDPEFKVNGRANDVTDPGLRERYGQRLFELMNWRPPEPYHLFAIDIDTASYVSYEEGTGRQTVWTWPRGGKRVVREGS